MDNRARNANAVVILGISAYYHDSAAAILVDGDIVAAASEERFTRRKADASFPHHAIGFCLETANCTIDDVDYIIFYENPVIKFERLIKTIYLTAPRSLSVFLAAMPKWLTENLWLERVIRKELGTKKDIFFCEHHMSHAASAFYPSPFDSAAILTIDGVGEWSTTTYGIGCGNEIKLLGESRFPNSLGLLYSAFTYYAGFKINSGEYKLMGLAPYGRPRFADIIKKTLLRINEDGTILLNQEYFSYTYSLHTINGKFEKLFGKAARKPEAPITQHEMDVAASIQEVTNEIVLKMARFVKQATGERYLVLAGGVALNVVTMGYIKERSGFDDIWIQPAAGDAGGSLGAAYLVWYQRLKNVRNAVGQDFMKGAFLGPHITPDSPEDDKVLERMGAVWKVLPEEELQNEIAEILAGNQVVGVARDRMEWGPRALGNRSILASARDREMQSKLNLKIKFRESFRPFAPMVIAEDASEYFEMTGESPYMLRTVYVKEQRRLQTGQKGREGIERINEARSDIPAVTHLDYSARVQTVDRKRHPFMYGVLQRYKEKTGCSVVVNTSFNVRGEPIVNTAEDAYRCFMATDMDYVVIGNRLLDKNKQKDRPMDEKERKRWLRRFELD